MSDVGINFPTWLVLVVLSFDFWRVVIVLELAALAAAFFMRGWWRMLALGVAVVLAADLAAAAVLALSDRRVESEARAYDQSIKTTLAAPRRVDGLALPAGTAITWRDPAQSQVMEAVLPQPMTLLGLTIDRLQRSVDEGWAVHLAGPQSVDGWTCQPDLVELAADGALRRCVVASAREWNGWTIPAATLVAPDPTARTVGFVFPTDMPVMAQEIGRNLPATGGMSMNADGSLNSVYFDAEAPLVVCGASLWNTVTWTYDTASFGQGRARRPEKVTGAAPAGDPIEVKPGACR